MERKNKRIKKIKQTWMNEKRNMNENIPPGAADQTVVKPAGFVKRGWEAASPSTASIFRFKR